MESLTPSVDFIAAQKAANVLLSNLAKANTDNVEAYVFQFTTTNKISTGYLFDDTNGDGTADQVIILSGVNNLGIDANNIIA